MAKPIVEVIWLDAIRTSDDISKREAPTVCRTVGYLLASTKKKVVVGMDHSGGGYRAGFAIPKGMVLKVKVLRKG